MEKEIREEDNMRKLIENEVEMLKGLKVRKFLDALKNIYKDDEDVLVEIQKCKSIDESLEYIDTYPAYSKSHEMFMDCFKKLLEDIGFIDLSVLEKENK
jgi:hypothetical protein